MSTGGKPLDTCLACGTWSETARYYTLNCTRLTVCRTLPGFSPCFSSSIFSVSPPHVRRCAPASSCGFLPSPLGAAGPPGSRCHRLHHVLLSAACFPPFARAGDLVHVKVSEVRVCSSHSCLRGICKVPARRIQQTGTPCECYMLLSAILGQRHHYIFYFCPISS